MTTGVLYISYDGMLEPLGQSQVLAYLGKLAVGRRIHLLSFEKPRDFEDESRVSALRERMAASGIAWHPQRYHKRPAILSSVYDLVIGAMKAWRLVRREELSIVHARSLICAAMGYPAARTNGAELLFDIRGFWADERVDGGMIRRGLVYRLLKLLDKAMLRAADHIVTLTEASVPYLRNDPAFGRTTAPISVIPTCVDVELFRPMTKEGASHGPFVLGYVGQVGTWYLLDEMVALFVQLRRRVPDARLLIVNQAQHEPIHAAMQRQGVPNDSYEVVPAPREQVPELIGRMTVGMALIKPAFSKIASCPTKLAEYLACGVPCVGNPKVGDVAEVIEANRVGVVLRDGGKGELERAVDEMLALVREPDLAARCRETAENHFSLRQGVGEYDRIYRQLEARAAPALAAESWHG